MSKVSVTPIAAKVLRLRDFFVARDFIYNDGKVLRRFSVRARTQALFAGAAAVTLGFSAFGVAQAAVGAAEVSGLAAPEASDQDKVVQMERRLQAMQANMAAIKSATEVHAARVEQRQALIAAVLTGRADADAITRDLPALDPVTNAAAAAVIAPLRRIEQNQAAMAGQARAAAEQRLSKTSGHLRRMGISPERLARMPAMGGPYEPVSAADAGAEARGDSQFRALFMTWKKLDTLEQAVVAVPSLQPVNSLSFTSNFGVRSDPFRGTAAMHAGVDIPGPVGTPIYATADGVVGRAERSGGYGNLVELEHGKGIQTRYGHLSRILVEAGTRVKRGQLIALMGSTGRSTGPHLHYEVRMDGHAVNPLPFLQTSDYLLAVQDRALQAQQFAMGGPSGN